MLSDTRTEFWEQLRRNTLPYIGRLLVEFNSHVSADLYVQGVTSRDQFVGIVHRTESQFERDLNTLNFESNPLAAWKKLYDTDVYETGSYRLPTDNTRGHGVSEELQTFLDANAVAWAPDMQLHVVIYQLDTNSDTIAVFAHYEPSWSTHPLVHYRSTHVYADLGREMMRTMLHDHYGEQYGSLVDETQEYCD